MSLSNKIDLKLCQMYDLIYYMLGITRECVDASLHLITLQPQNDIFSERYDMTSYIFKNVMQKHALYHAMGGHIQEPRFRGLT